MTTELHDELTFELSQKLFASGCQLNSKRIKILADSFLKLCRESPKFGEIFKEEVAALESLNREEAELKHSLGIF